MREKLHTPNRFDLLVLMAGLVTVIWCCCATAGQSDAKDHRPGDILVLHSYHQGLVWTDEVNRGIVQGLGAIPRNAELCVEYLDTKHYTSSVYMAQLYSLLATKYTGRRFAVIITSDDNAFQFSLRYREALFGSTPIVFCGVNALEVYHGSPVFAPLMKNLTGVVEGYDVAQTLRCALDLHPAAKTVYVINDRTTTGKSNKQLVVQAESRIGRRVAFVFLEDLTMAELLDRLDRITPPSIILLMSFNRDSAGQVFSYRQSIDRIAARAKAPIYGVWGFYLGHGIVGGMLTAGFDQGRAAAGLVKKIVAGTRADDLPIITKSPNRFMFDDVLLRRFAIDPKRLPPGSVRINEPDSFYRRNRRVIWITVLVLLAQTATIMIMTMSIWRQRRAETALKDSEERYRRIYLNVQDAYYEATLDGTLLELSPSIDKVLGFTPAELIGRSLDDIYLRPDDRRTVVEDLQRRDRLPDYEVVLKNKAGQPVHCAINAVLVRDGAGQPVRIIGSMRNIEARKKDEIEKQRLRERLYRAEKMEAIGTIAGGVAHDLNNILGGLVSYPELLLYDLETDSPMRRPLETIRRSGEKAAAIVEDLLTLTRRAVVVKETVDLNTVVSDYMVSPEFYKLKAFHPQIEFGLDLDPVPAVITGSPVHLSKTVMNLVSNAAEAITANGRVQIRTGHAELDKPVRGYQSVEPGPYVTLTVSDTGEGMSEEDLELIFEPFYTKKKMGRSGTGLGMAVVWGTVNDHSGYIHIDSIQGGGTTVTVYLPAQKVVYRPAISSTAEEPVPGGSETVLVVDDVAEQRQIAETMLSGLGYHVHVVDSGEAAVEFIQHTPVDLLVLDMIMDPGMDGQETYKAIADICPGQRAIIVSGYTETRRVKSTRRLGVGGYLRKPYTLAQLGRAVRAELDREV